MFFLIEAENILVNILRLQRMIFKNLITFSRKRAELFTCRTRYAKVGHLKYEYSIIPWRPWHITESCRVSNSYGFYWVFTVMNRILVTYPKPCRPPLSDGPVEWLFCQELFAFVEFAAWTLNPSFPCNEPLSRFLRTKQTSTESKGQTKQKTSWEVFLGSVLVLMLYEAHLRRYPSLCDVL